MPSTTLVVAAAVGGSAAAGFAFLAYRFVTQPDTWSGDEREELIGEEMVDAKHPDTVKALAERMFTEASRIMSSSSGWTTTLEGEGVVVEAKKVSGVFESSGCLLTRAGCRIDKYSAAEVFALLTSVEGYSIIDPGSDPEDFKTPGALGKVDWGPGRRLELDRAYAMKGTSLFKPREFCVLNAIDPSRAVFASKSILVKDMPGGSAFSSAGAPPNGNVRALNTFAAHCIPNGTGGCTLVIVNWIQMFGEGRVADALTNWVNCKGFIPGLIHRLKSRLDFHAAAREAREGKVQVAGAMV
mmetsp:Transcript_54181/g.171951  ORF Transcript_54181/g.171951 Transcript_54181/m.171951 type:complete len:298 (-) Transcript_54181:330-1223(-)